MGLAIQPVFALLMAAGLGLVGALWLLRPDPRTGYARQAAEREFPAGLEPPSRWATDVVLERLRELDRTLLDRKLGCWLTSSEIDALFQRRDLIVARADRLVDQWGEKAILVP